MLVRKNNLECRRSVHRNRGRGWFGNSSVRCGRRRGHGDADWRSPRRGHRNQPRPQRQSLGCRQRSLLTFSCKRNSLFTRRSSRQTPTWAKSSVREFAVLRRENSVHRRATLSTCSSSSRAKRHKNPGLDSRSVTNYADENPGLDSRSVTNYSDENPGLDSRSVTTYSDENPGLDSRSVTNCSNENPGLDSRSVTICARVQVLIRGQ